jgi:iron(II)-dependent oxidoreductase
MTGLPILPLRVDFTHEDKAAKGLRSLREPEAAPIPPVHFTAEEMVAATPRLVLLGGWGAGKTVLARGLAGKGAELVEIKGPHSLDAVTSEDGLLILDGIDRLGAEGASLIADLATAQGERPMLMLGDGAVVAGWALPDGFQLHRLMPLSEGERAEAVERLGVSPAVLSPIGATPALFAALARLEERVETGEELADRIVAGEPDRGRAALAALDGGTSADRAVDALLAARALAEGAAAEMAGRFAADPQRWSPVLESYLRRQDDLAPVAEALLASEAGMAASLLLAPRVDAGSALRAPVARVLLSIVETGSLSAPQRDAAGRILSVWGDPRDLDRLCAVPGGRFTMGSDCHPNSQPIHEAEVGDFRIGAYPVTNARYGVFVAATGRDWVSPEAGRPEKANAPATDLTWHDARAFCDWLTDQWRAAGTIGADEIVRLPTEPEWERAARGDQPAAGAAPVYPWGLQWNPDAANCEETGFNAPCAVGLFPAGRSPYGCADMAGQVWEWTTTLWGEDMATPSFAYPYGDDGREDPDAPASVRRVLRGGCFSSTRLKAGAVYRGSLEPNGFWRGNGFRIVVAKR